MKTMYLLFSHTLTPEQEADAKKSLGVERFVYLPKELQQLWSAIPPELDDLNAHLSPLQDYLKAHLKPHDVALIQGDFGATCYMVRQVRTLGGKAVYATTKRDVTEVQEGDKVIKRSVFAHVRFREFV